MLLNKLAFRKSYGSSIVLSVLLLAVLGLFISCQDDNDIVSADSEDSFVIAIRSEWIDGRTTSTTRILPDGLNKLSKPDTPLPKWLYVYAPDRPDKSFLAKTKDDITGDSDNELAGSNGYTNYHDFYIWEDGDWKKQEKSPVSRSEAKNLVAYYQVDDGDFLPEFPIDPITHQKCNYTPWDKLPDFLVKPVGSSDYMSSDAVSIPTEESEPGYPDHLLFTYLHHRTALLRLLFKVSEDYDEIRSIIIRKLLINGEEVTLNAMAPVPTTDEDGNSGSDGLVLTTSEQVFGCMYINPEDTKKTDPAISKFSPDKEWSFECTYDIYDKDQILSSHLVRKAVTAVNKVKVSNLASSSINEINEGYYYDLTITIDPDYLYVLSEHDNKQHLTIR